LLSFRRINPDCREGIEVGRVRAGEKPMARPVGNASPAGPDHRPERPGSSG
jgi:hypothetical protein